MGGSSTRSFDFASYASTSAAYKAAPSAAAAFKSRGMDPYLDPKNFTIRESRNSENNPKSTPCIFATDVTGSMGMLALEIVRNGLGKLIKEVIDRNPVSDPHLMFMAVGDVTSDSAPLQVSQFETDLKIVEQLEKVYVEGGGGGNSFESYNLPWHFAAYHTSADAFEKDGRKGFLFTMGDERCPPDLTEAGLSKVYGRGQEPLATNKELLENLSGKYHVFHLIIEEGSAMLWDSPSIKRTWNETLGQRAILVADHTKLPEIIISTMQVVNGEDKDDVIKSWSGDTSLVVAKAVNGLVAETSAEGGLVRV